MAKRKRSKGKRRGGKRRGGKRKSKKSKVSAKHSMALEGSGAWDAYKVLTSDGLGATLIKAPFDKTARDGLASYAKGGLLKNNVLANTRELQLVAMVKIGQKVPIIKGPVNMAVNAINSLGRQMGIKGKWKLV